MVTTQLKIDGMTCPHCARAVSGALQAVPGVAGAEVNLERGNATVQGDVDLRVLIQAVAAAGYAACPSA